ncbi:MAG: hypothetical protein K6T85_03395 [Gorillibacterium sp.]|nr:hypothetical protein [Gorillibacterium sp.]
MTRTLVKTPATQVNTPAAHHYRESTCCTIIYWRKRLPRNLGMGSNRPLFSDNYD